jgi:UDP-N-acetylmuramoylalanine--D-glutamate ligase
MLTMKEQHPQHDDCRYLVVGLGLTGFSVAGYLLARGYDVCVQDDRNEPPYRDQLLAAWPTAQIISTTLSLELAEDFDCLVVSPGLSIRGQVLKKVAESGKRIIGDIELFAEAVDAPVVAITGSNGKSTVTALVGEMIEADGKSAAVGGNFGVPALQLLEQGADIYVLELSSFQLETTSSLQPAAATVLNVSEDHMDRYDDLNDYGQTKKTIYRHARHCVSNLDDELTACAASDTRFSLHDERAEFHVSSNDPAQFIVRGESWLHTDELKLKGRHNWANCLAAMALADACKISRQAIVSALRSFAGLPHRSQWVAEIDGVNWINDSKATNPGAARAAIEGLSEPVILLAGGQGKGADMSMLRETLRGHVKTVLLFGQDADLMQSAWQGCTEIERVDNLQQAVQHARRIAVQGDVVLLSPACASFDQFKGFAHRGECFAEFVRALA